MTRFIALFLALCCIFVCTACKSDPPAETVPETTTSPESQPTITYPVPTREEMPVSDSDVDWGLTLTATEVSRNSISLSFAQSGGDATGDLQTGAYFSLEAYDGSWTPATSLHPNEEIAWNAIAYLIPKDGETETVEDWSFLYGPQRPGWYRLGKEVTDFRGPGDADTAMFYVYFEVK